MPKMIRAAAVAAIAAPLLFLASPASAGPPGAGATPDKGGGSISTLSASCGRTAPDRDPSPYLRALVSGSSGANQRSGSSTSCGILGVLQPTDYADYHCYTSGNDGYTWTYLRNTRTNVAGWVRDDLLRDNGSYVYCGF